MRRRKSSLTTIIIVILLIIVGVIFAYIYMQDKELEKMASTISETSKKKENKEKEEELDLDNEIVKNAINDFNNISGTDKYNDFKIDSIDNYRLVLTAINGLEDDQITWCISSTRQITATITIDDLNKALNKYIKDTTLTIDDIKNNKGETSLTVGEYGYDSYAITIDEDNNIHIIGGCDGRKNGLQKERIATKTIKAFKKNDELYIYTKVAYGKLDKYSSKLSYDYYKTYEKTGEMVEIVSLDDELTWDKYDTYKQIYKESGDKYYFVSSKIE
ncbi:MAG: hypothetical protein IK137_01440 [Bacilli bacterium]|nr:hypothetical protein [Bacilli bacterium]